MPVALAYARMDSGRVHSMPSTTGGRDGQPGGVHRPALARLQLGARAAVLAQEGRQGPQQPTQVAAADLARDAQRLDEAISDRVAQASLEAVETVLESPARPVVAGERGKGGPQLLGAADRQLALPPPAVRSQGPAP